VAGVADDLTFDIIVRDRNGTEVMRKFGKSAEDAGRQIEDIGGRAEKGGGKLRGLFAAVGPALVAGAAAAGALAGAALMKGFQASAERELATDRLGAQLGLPPEKAKEFGGIAGKLYTQAFGTSVADNAAAIRAVWTSGLLSEDADNGAIEKMTAQAMTFADVMGKDVVLSARAAGQMVRNGLAKNGEEAFDLLTRMIQNTGDHADDLLDTMVEYSTQFREVGLDGQKALGMISQALRAGARDADTVADAIKEFAIRSKDGSKVSAEGFKAIGLDAKKMFRVFADGGPAADKAMTDVIARLKAMKDPVAQDAAAVALFGTKAEDLQDALYAINPATAVDSLGKTKGAVDGLSSAYDNNATKVEEMKRRAEQALADLADRIVAFFTEDIEGSWKITQLLSDIGDDMKALADEHIPRLKEHWQGLIDDIGVHQEELRVVAEAVGLAAVAAAYTFITFGRVAAGTVGATVALFRGMVNHILRGWGLVLDGAVAAFGWVPGIGGKLKSAQKKFDEFRRKANEALGGIKDQTVNVDVNLRGIRNLEEQMAVRLGRREHGGPVRRGEAYIVGEKRAEIFVPDQDGTILPDIPHRGSPTTLGGVGAGGTELTMMFPRNGSGLDQMFITWFHRMVSTGQVQLAARNGQARLAVTVG
jgi:hypothetical protein